MSYNVIKNRKDKGNVEKQDIIVVDEIDYIIIFDDFITPNH